MTEEIELLKQQIEKLERSRFSIYKRAEKLQQRVIKLSQVAEVYAKPFIEQVKALKQKNHNLRQDNIGLVSKIRKQKKKIEDLEWQAAYRARTDGQEFYHMQLQIDELKNLLGLPVDEPKTYGDNKIEH